MLASGHGPAYDGSIQGFEMTRDTPLFSFADLRVQSVAGPNDVVITVGVYEDHPTMGIDRGAYTDGLALVVRKLCFWLTPPRRRQWRVVATRPDTDRGRVLPPALFERTFPTLAEAASAAAGIARSVVEGQFP